MINTKDGSRISAKTRPLSLHLGLVLLLFFSQGYLGVVKCVDNFFHNKKNENKKKNYKEMCNRGGEWNKMSSTKFWQVLNNEL